jgi:zinc protease
MARVCRYAAIILALLSCAARLEPGVAGTAVPPDRISETLDNGLQVTIVADPELPVVATQVWYHVGSANEDPESRGFAHLFEHLMFGGTRRFPKEAYARHHTDHGGYENAYTSTDETVYISEIVPEHHDRVLEMEADRMVNLLLNEENLANEKRIVTEELRLGTENDPLARVMVAAQKAVLGEHPYAYSPVGTKQDVAAATLEYCRKFYGKYYGPRNAHLVIVGPVDGPAKMERVRELFGPIPATGTTPPEVPPLAGWSYPDDVVLKEDLPPAETALYGFPMPGPDSPEYWAVLVLSQMMGHAEVDPFAEILVDRRNKAVYADTQWFFLRRGSVLILAAAHLPYRRKATAYRLTEQTLEELSSLQWLTEETLEGARKTLLRREWAAVYYAESRAREIGEAAWSFGDESIAFRRADRIREVTREQVAGVFRKYVTEAEPIRVYLRPEKVPLYVRLFGWLYPLVSR